MQKTKKGKRNKKKEEQKEQEETPIVFISHIKEEQDIASELKNFVKSAFGGKIEVFVSTDFESIQMGKSFLDAIKGKLQRCVAVIVVASPQSVMRPWINFEGGSGWIRDIPVIPICHSGMTPTTLPAPLTYLQTAMANQEKELLSVLQSLKDAISKHVQKGDFSASTNGFSKLPGIRDAVSTFIKKVKTAEAKNVVQAAGAVSMFTLPEDADSIRHKLTFAIDQSLHESKPKFCVMGIVFDNAGGVENSFLIEAALEELALQQGGNAPVKNKVDLTVVVHDATTDSARLHLNGDSLSIASFRNALQQKRSASSWGIDSDTTVLISRAPPSCSAFVTPVGTFFQPYLFRQTRPPGQLPIFWRNEQGDGLRESLDRHVSRGKCQSIARAAFYDEYDHSLDVTARQMGLNNHYWPDDGDSFSSVHRMKFLLENDADERLWIKAVSLKLFLGQSGSARMPLRELSSKIRKAFLNAIQRCDEVKILFLDPTCDDAKRRAFRETLALSSRETDQDLGKNDSSDFAAFCKEYDAGRATTVLADDTRRSLVELRRQLRRHCSTEKSQQILNECVRYYGTGPGEFLLITDTSAITEPLNFGEPDEDQGDLSRKMPMSEFVKQSGCDKNNTYGVLANHFDFVLKHFSRPVAWREITKKE